MQPRNIVATIALSGAIVLGGVWAYAESLSTQDFVYNASVANEFEIETSRLALTKAHNANVKEFAQEMINDHTKTGKKLEAALKNSKSDAKPAKELDDKHQELLEELKSTADADFEKKYVDIQKDAHKEAVDLFMDYSANGTDDSVRAFATQTLPKLTGHLKHVKELSKAQKN